MADDVEYRSGREPGTLRSWFAAFNQDRESLRLLKGLLARTSPMACNWTGTTGTTGQIRRNLHQVHIPYCQGYLFGTPMTANTFAQFIEHTLKLQAPKALTRF